QGAVAADRGLPADLDKLGRAPFGLGLPAILEDDSLDLVAREACARARRVDDRVGVSTAVVPGVGVGEARARRPWLVRRRLLVAVVEAVQLPPTRRLGRLEPGS